MSKKDEERPRQRHDKRRNLLVIALCLCFLYVKLIMTSTAVRDFMNKLGVVPFFDSSISTLYSVLCISVHTLHTMHARLQAAALCLHIVTAGI